MIHIGFDRISLCSVWFEVGGVHSIGKCCETIQCDKRTTLHWNMKENRMSWKESKVAFAEHLKFNFKQIYKLCDCATDSTYLMQSQTVNVFRISNVYVKFRCGCHYWFGEFDFDVDFNGAHIFITKWRLAKSERLQTETVDWTNAKLCKNKGNIRTTLKFKSEEMFVFLRSILFYQESKIMHIRKKDWEKNHS